MSQSRPAWNEGGKEVVFDYHGISITHDELVTELGDAYKKITDAGFVIVPKSWRERVMNHLGERGKDESSTQG